MLSRCDMSTILRSTRDPCQTCIFFARFVAPAEIHGGHSPHAEATTSRSSDGTQRLPWAPSTACTVSFGVAPYVLYQCRVRVPGQFESYAMRNPAGPTDDGLGAAGIECLNFRDLDHPRDGLIALLVE